MKTRLQQIQNHRALLINKLHARVVKEIGRLAKHKRAGVGEDFNDGGAAASELH